MELYISSHMIFNVTFTIDPIHTQESKRREELISSLPGKSSPIDVIPASIIKSSSDVFGPLIKRLAELSFREGRFLTQYHQASVTPILKKGLGRDSRAN